MDENLLSLELSIFSDWLCERFDDLIWPAQINNDLISAYLSERSDFAHKEKKKYPILLEDIIP